MSCGEVGLDYHYDLSPRNVQRAVFTRQLEHAVRLGKPLTIHTPEVEGDREDSRGSGAQGASPACRATFVMLDPDVEPLVSQRFTRTASRILRSSRRGCSSISLTAASESQVAAVVSPCWLACSYYRDVQVRHECPICHTGMCGVATKSSHGLGHVASRTGGVPYRMQGIQGVESVMYHPFATSHRSLYSDHTESLCSFDSTKTCQQNGAMDGGIWVGCCERRVPT